MKKQPAVLAGDIGGTKTNLGLFVRGKARPKALVSEKFSSHDARSLDAIIEQMLKRYPARIKAACCGIAGPVINGECRATNLPWVVSEKRLQKRFGWRQVRLINDLGSTAMAVPLLNHREVKALNGLRVYKSQNIGLVAPGTGLGLALLVYADGRFRPVPSEGGHAGFAPADELEIDLWHYLRTRFGHVSMERVLSGRGLVNIYNWLKSGKHHPESAGVKAAMHKSDPARVITHNAINDDDPLCRAALKRFCRILGSVAGNLALTGMTTGGLFLGGGIPPRIIAFLQADDFLNAFNAKGRFTDFMKKIAVRVILNDQAALLGAAHIALGL
jgi:glucokinase